LHRSSSTFGVRRKNNVITHFVVREGSAAIAMLEESVGSWWGGGDGKGRGMLAGVENRGEEAEGDLD
jgi:hypothetical protein